MLCLTPPYTISFIAFVSREEGGGGGGGGEGGVGVEEGG